MTRYKEKVYTPGSKDDLTPEIIVRDPEAENSLDTLRARRRELDARLSQVRGELAKSVDDLGRSVFAGEDPLELSRQIAHLRLEIEGIEAGITFIDRKMTIIFRSNSWLRR